MKDYFWSLINIGSGIAAFAIMAGLIRAFKALFQILQSTLFEKKLLKHKLDFAKRQIKTLQKEASDVLRVKFILICFLCGSLYLYKSIWGAKEIGNWFERPSYRTQYWINLFFDEDAVESYRLKANISVYDKEYEDSDGNSHTGPRVIEIEEIYLSDKKKIVFEDENCQALPNIKNECNLPDGEDEKVWIELVKPA